MWYGRGPFFRMGFGPFTFGLWGPGFWGFPRRQEYLEMLERYREHLQRELRAVEREIEELRKEEGP